MYPSHIFAYIQISVLVINLIIADIILIRNKKEKCENTGKPLLQPRPEKITASLLRTGLSIIHL